MRTSHIARATCLFACLRTSDGNAAALFALARDFSPRIERYGDACVVLDVSGLGRLLGDAHGIAAELRRAAEDRGLTPQIAIAPTQTAALLMTLAEKTSVVTADPAAALAPLSLTVLSALDRTLRTLHSHPSHPSHPLFHPGHPETVGDPRRRRVCRAAVR